MLTNDKPKRLDDFMLRFLFRLLLACGLALLSLSCSSTPSAMEEEARPDHFWIGDQVSGSPRMVVSLSQQRLYYFKGDKLVGASPVSTGRQPGWTKTGSFRITEKDIDHRSSCYGAYVDADGNVVQEDVDCRVDPAPPGTRYVGAEMHYFMRVVGAIGMHKGYLPGYPASHGCIRLPGNMAEIFYHATPLGTPIEVRSGPLHVQEPTRKVLAEAKKPEAKPAPVAAAPSRQRRHSPGLQAYPRRYLQPGAPYPYPPRPRGYGRGYPRPPAMAPGTTLYLY